MDVVQEAIALLDNSSEHHKLNVAFKLLIGVSPNYTKHTHCKVEIENLLHAWKHDIGIAGI